MASRLGRPNPVLERGFNVARVNMGAFAPADTATMTIDGTVRKTALLLGIVAAAGIGTALLGQVGLLLALPAMLVGLVMALVLAFKPHLAPKLAVPYAVAEGIFVGAISAIYANAFGEGIIVQAVLLTFGILGGLLLAYRSGKIRVTDNFRLGVVAATVGVALFHMVALVGSLVGFRVPLLWDNGPWGIVFSLVVVGIASMNLVLDFDFIERGEQSRLPQSMEWYGAFAVLVTMIWLYLEILRLLAKLQSRR